MTRKPAPSTVRLMSTGARKRLGSDPPPFDIEAELERRNAFLQLLQVVSVAANGAPTSMTRALQKTLDEVCRQIGWSVGHALLPDGDAEDTLVSSGIWHVSDPDRVAELRDRHKAVRFALGVGVPGRVFATGVPEHIADVQALSDDNFDRVRCALLDREHMRAVAGFPIIIGDEVGGVLEFFSEAPFEPDRMLLDVMAQVGMVLGRVVERTRYEAALRRAREVAEVANAAKTEFLSRMSHELRTPLTAVLGYAELLQLSPLPDRDRGYVAAIEKGGNHLLALINDVLDVSRLEKGELRLSVEPLDVVAIVLEAVALMRPLAARYAVTLRAALPESDHPTALGDNQALRQVMLNLIANGVKYNQENGEVVVTVTESPAETVRVDVADTGRGIPAADLDSIFVPFERLGAARTVEGTGLGLGISRQLVDAMGGTLEVHSEVGSGTTLSILLTASDVTLHADAGGATPPPARERADESRTVLYVEDNVVNIELMQSMFTRLRPGVDLVSTMLGDLAVDLARAHAPQLILLDVNLPDIDGDEVLRRLKSDDRTQAIPVVIVSADAIPSGIDRFIALGALGYITKPIEVARLLEFVDAATGTDGRDPEPVLAELAGRARNSSRPRIQGQTVS
jgi:signal transduction histidine kinase/CheY-like chemotaxis protein